MNASMLQYDRRDCERTLLALDDLEAERAALEILYAHASDDDEDRIALALAHCEDAVGVLKDRLHETKYDIGLRGGEWR